MDEDLSDMDLISMPGWLDAEEQQFTEQSRSCLTLEELDIELAAFWDVPEQQTAEPAVATVANGAIATGKPSEPRSCEDVGLEDPAAADDDIQDSSHSDVESTAVPNSHIRNDSVVEVNEGAKHEAVSDDISQSSNPQQPHSEVDEDSPVQTYCTATSQKHHDINNAQDQAAVDDVGNDQPKKELHRGEQAAAAAPSSDHRPNNVTENALQTSSSDGNVAVQNSEAEREFTRSPQEPTPATAATSFATQDQEPQQHPQVSRSAVSGQMHTQAQHCEQSAISMDENLPETSQQPENAPEAMPADPPAALQLVGRPLATPTIKSMLPAMPNSNIPSSGKASLVADMRGEEDQRLAPLRRITPLRLTDEAGDISARRSSSGAPFKDFQDLPEGVRLAPRAKRASSSDLPEAADPPTGASAEDAESEAVDSMMEDDVDEEQKIEPPPAIEDQKADQQVVKGRKRGRPRKADKPAKPAKKPTCSRSSRRLQKGEGQQDAANTEQTPPQSPPEVVTDDISIPRVMSIVPSKRKKAASTASQALPGVEPIPQKKRRRLDPDEITTSPLPSKITKKSTTTDGDADIDHVEEADASSKVSDTGANGAGPEGQIADGNAENSEIASCRDGLSSELDALPSKESKCTPQALKALRDEWNTGDADPALPRVRRGRQAQQATVTKDASNAIQPVKGLAAAEQLIVDNPEPADSSILAVEQDDDEPVASATPEPRGKKKAMKTNKNASKGSTPTGEKRHRAAGSHPLGKRELEMLRGVLLPAGKRQSTGGGGRVTRAKQEVMKEEHKIGKAAKKGMAKK